MDTVAKDLRELYPDSPKVFDSVEEMQKNYCGRALQEGFKLECSDN